LIKVRAASHFFLGETKGEEEKRGRGSLSLLFSSLLSAMSSRWLSGASVLAARALRASSGAAASSSGGSSSSSLLIPIESASASSSSFFASAFFSRRRAFVTSQPAARYLPPVSTGGPAMLDGGA